MCAAADGSGQWAVVKPGRDRDEARSKAGTGVTSRQAGIKAVSGNEHVRSKKDSAPRRMPHRAEAQRKGQNLWATIREKPWMGRERGKQSKKRRTAARRAPAAAKNGDGPSGRARTTW